MDFIDIGLCVALIAVFAHNMRLSRKIDGLVFALREMAPMVENFSAAVDRSEKVGANMAKERKAIETKLIPAQADKPRKGTALTDIFYGLARQGRKA